jgi:osmotically-inducible protein OsmY
VTYVDNGPSYVREEIIVTAPRSIDQAITNDVVDRIASNPTISGRIGVETHNRDVTLTGRTTTEGQMERAEREARSVEGVRDVNNRIWPRVGKF